MIVLKTDIFDSWLRKLKDNKAKAIILTRIKRIEVTGNLGNYKYLDKGISELKIDFGPGYRIYFAKVDDLVILLTNGGSKKTQPKDIARAVEIFKRSNYE